MQVVDTSAWIEWLLDSATGKQVLALLPEQNEWVVPTIVQLELTKWLVREVGEDKADQVLAFSMLCKVQTLDTEIALAAAEMCGAHKLATADAIVYASARAANAELLTRDAHFEGLPGVRLIPKLAG